MVPIPTISLRWNRFPILLAAHSQNSEATNPVAERLGSAYRAWVEWGEPRELRKVLLAIRGYLMDEARPARRHDAQALA